MKYNTCQQKLQKMINFKNKSSTWIECQLDTLLYVTFVTELEIFITLSANTVF